MTNPARFALTLALVLSVAACEQQPTPAPPPEGWAAYPIPPPRACAWERARESTRDWRVRLADGRLTIEPDTEVAPYPAWPAFQIPAEEKGWTCPECVMRVGDGVLVGTNKGEFGGRLWWTDAAGGNAYAVSHAGRCSDIADTGRPVETEPSYYRAQNVHALMRAGDRIFALIGLAHLDLHNGEFDRVERKNGKWQTCLVHNLETVPVAVVADDAESWFVMTGDGLVRVDVRGAMRKFGTFAFMQEGLYPGSMVKLADGTLYAGAHHFVARLTPEPYGVYREELFVPKGRPEFDDEPWIDAPTARNPCKGKKPSERPD